MGFDFSSASDSQANPLSYFSGRADDYENYRPVHPASAIDAILSGLHSPKPLVAADIGSGTGIGARLLADRGVRVMAIEPNDDMRMAAAPHKSVEFLTGTAEHIPLEAGSVDIVSSFQAFHWFDFSKSLQEFSRILKPNGRLALVWSFWDQRDSVSKTYSCLIFAASKELEPPAQPPRRIKTWLKKLRYQLFWQGLWLPGFVDLQRQEFTFSQQLDRLGLIGLARSQGFTPAEGPALDKLVAELTALHQHYADEQDKATLRYRTYLYTATIAKAL